MRKELRNRGIEHLRVVFSPEEPTRAPDAPDGAEAPPPGRAEHPRQQSMGPRCRRLLLGSAVVRDLIEKGRA